MTKADKKWLAEVEARERALTVPPDVPGWPSRSGDSNSDILRLLVLIRELERKLEATQRAYEIACEERAND